MQYQAPRGTYDILPQDQAHWRFVEEKIRTVSQLYGYQRIDTPVFEDAHLFVRSIGEGTDIVEKEMYTFEDRGGRPLTLRPEGTASVCRAYLEHGMHNLGQPVKLYYVAPLFRYEAPQAGRFRQHWQFGVEAIGEGDPSLDAEVIEMCWVLYERLGLSGLVLKINSIGCRQCRPHYLEVLKAYYTERVGQLCPDCRRRAERNTLRLLDCKNEACMHLTERAPRTVDYLCTECGEHFEKLERYLKTVGLGFDIDHRLVRGLDYYTRTVFEIQPSGAKGAQSTIGGGGRYDNLMEELGGKPTPAIGFGTGLERIILNLKQQDVHVPPLPRPDVFVAFMGEEAKRKALEYGAAMRRRGISCVLSFGDRSLKAQLRQANSLGVTHAIIIGEDELKDGVVALREMAGGAQRRLTLDEVIKSLTE